MEKHGEKSIIFSLQQLNTEKHINVSEYIYGILVSLGYGAAIIYSAVITFEIETNHLLLLMGLILEAVILNIFWHKYTKYIFVALPFAAMILLNEMMNVGLASIGNKVYEKIGSLVGEIYDPFAVAENVGELNSTAVLIVAGFWIILMGSHIVRDINCIIAGITAIIITAVGLIFPNELGWISSSLAAIVFIVTWIKNFISYKYNGINLAKILKKMYIPLISGIIISAMILCLFSQEISSFSMKTATSNISYLETLLDRLIYGDDEKRSMPTGKFEGLSSLETSDEIMLEISSENIQSYYLRGFVGGEYTGQGWKPLDNEVLYDQADVFYWMHENGIFGQTQLSKSAQVLDEKTAEDSTLLNIRNIGADSKYYYVPYEATSVKDADEIMSSNLLNEDCFVVEGWHKAESYTIESIDKQVNRYKKHIAKLFNELNGNVSDNVKQYIDAEAHYNNFVYQNYTSVPLRTERLIERGLSAAKEERRSETERTGYNEAKAAVLSFLNQAVTYSESIETYSNENDFIDYFLTESREGYSVHYATTATMILRYYGIPARYVEGYLITPEKVQSAEDGESLYLTDEDSHAWVEYYQDGIGWIPFEVTPSYMNVMGKTESFAYGNANDGTEEDYNPYESESQKSGSLGLEMIEDNYEKEEEKEIEEEFTLPLEQIAVISSLIILLIVLALIIVHLSRRFKKLMTLHRSFESDDYAECIRSLFAYIMEIHKAIGVKIENKSIFSYEEEIKDIADDDTASKYMNIAGIYQKAAYSCHEMTIEERNKLIEYKDTILGLVKEQTLTKRFKLKWINGLY